MVLDSMAEFLPPDGVLYLGGAETVLGISEKFQPVSGMRGPYCLTASDSQFQKAVS